MRDNEDARFHACLSRRIAAALHVDPVAIAHRLLKLAGVMFYPLERIGFDAVTKSDRGDSRQGGGDAPGDGTAAQWLNMSYIIISLYRLLSGPLLPGR